MMAAILFPRMPPVARWENSRPALQQVQMSVTLI